ncbi:hypothetical protein QTA56_02165 [Acinetobacter sp. VNH17]|uniref:Lipoprotein n=1 Tax=Acinetobacter thutiue TaxID=2998078 RepID=A0ABT7WK58_9GAMM|nr:hypothetical protein [Acinetobacter thutiue]MCY6410939.1 hypothetical protein [Acinetobacter thutiue]MDN0013041.1 hypothetical protein [Acinetobacter thutiue]
MPSLSVKQRTYHHIGLGLGTLILSSVLISCGSGESKARIDNTPVVSVPKPKNFDIKVPVEMRNVVVKVLDNTDNSIVLEQTLSTTTNLSLTLPIVLNRSHLYRVELSTLPNSLIYDFISGQYQDFSMTLHTLVNVDTSNLTQNIFINPSSEAIYQRSLIRSGQLPNEPEDPTGISSLHLKMATADINSALLNAFGMNIHNLDPSYLLNAFTPQTMDMPQQANLYTTTYLSFGYLKQWANQFPNNTFTEFTKNLAIDLRDGYLDAKKIRGDQDTLISIVPIAPENVDPAKNTLLNITINQKSTRDQYAASLKESVLELANMYQQQNLNPTGYALLQQKDYSDREPTIDSTSSFRIAGAGDYRRAVGFIDVTGSCNGSKYSCKQGVTGINLVNANLPSIEYLIGHYEDKTNGCQLNIRANGALELIKDSKMYRSVLDADSTDNLLQVDKASSEYLLNSSSPEPSNESLKYTFVQVHIKANQVLSAQAGLDSRKAPDEQLQETQAQCSFS